MADSSGSGTIEERSDVEKNDEGTVKFWRGEIENSNKYFEKWMERADKVVKRYRAEDRMARASRRFHILWANTEILKGTVYSQMPTPDVRRRYKDQDPIGRAAAEVVQRGLAYSIEDYDFDSVMESVRDDLLLPGRGVARAVYDPNIERIDLVEQRSIEVDESTGDSYERVAYFDPDGMEVEPDDIDDKGPYIEEIGYQSVRCEYVFWKDYRESPARKWEDVWWVGFQHFMRRKELRDQFGSAGRKVPLTVASDPYSSESTSRKRNEKPPQSQLKFARVWEIWDKDNRERIWIADGYDGVLLQEDDPLGLEGFFPNPEPAAPIMTTDSRVPIPEYTMYQDLAMELDELSTRKKYIIRAIKARGIFPAVLKEIATLVSDVKETELLAVTDHDQFRERGGLSKAIEWMPLEMLANTLIALNQEIENLKGQIYEVTGISDLVRGNTRASESATAQRIKGAFGSIRLNPRRKPMDRFVRDMLRIKAEIMSEHFTDENISEMVGMPVDPQVLEVLRDDRSRGFKIDIDTNSTVEPDQEAETQRYTQYVQGITQFIQTTGPLIQQTPVLAPLMFEILKTFTRHFKEARMLEEYIDRMADQIIQSLGQSSQESPDTSLEEAQIDADVRREEAQVDAAIRSREQAQEAQLSREEMAMKERVERFKAIEGGRSDG